MTKRVDRPSTLRPYSAGRRSYCETCQEYYNNRAASCPYCRTEKACAECKIVKPLDQFYRHNQQPDGRDSECIQCVREHVHIYRTYGISKTEYENLLELQDGVCAICRKEPAKRLHVDHDHETGAVRGLLCIGCNQGLGNFQDDVYSLVNAIIYLTNKGSK